MKSDYIVMQLTYFTYLFNFNWISVKLLSQQRQSQRGNRTVFMFSEFSTNHSLGVYHPAHATHSTSLPYYTPINNSLALLFIISPLWNVTTKQEGVACLQWRSGHFMHPQVVTWARFWGVASILYDIIIILFNHCTHILSQEHQS